MNKRCLLGRNISSWPKYGCAEFALNVRRICTDLHGLGRNLHGFASHCSGRKMHRICTKNCAQDTVRPKDDEPRQTSDTLVRLIWGESDGIHRLVRFFFFSEHVSPTHLTLVLHRSQVVSRSNFATPSFWLWWESQLVVGCFMRSSSRAFVWYLGRGVLPGCSRVIPPDV